MKLKPNEQPQWIDDSGLEERVLSVRTVQEGRIFNYEELTVEFPNGDVGLRDVIRHPGATGIVAINEKREVLLVNQYRTALGRVTTEIPAGRLEAGEDPLDCATRELEEETAWRAGSMERLATINTCAGFCDEALHIYIAHELTPGVLCLDTDEFVNQVWVPLDEAVAACKSGLIQDSKTIIGLLMVADRFS